MSNDYYNQPPPQGAYLQPPPHRSPSPGRVASPGYEYMTGPASAPPQAPSPPVAARRISTSTHLTPDAARGPISLGYPFPPSASPPTSGYPAPPPTMSRGNSYNNPYYGAPQPAIPPQNPPYIPYVQQHTPPAPGYPQPYQFPSYPSPQQLQQQQIQPYNPEMYRTQSYGSPYASPQPQLAQSYPADSYDMSLRPPPRERSYSTNSTHSRRSHRSTRSSGEYTRNEDGTRKSKKQREREAYAAALDRKPSFGDTVVMAIDVLKGAVTGKRD